MEATACARRVRVPDPRVSPWRVRAARALATSGTYASQTREFATYVYATRAYAAALSETDACRLRQSSSRTLARGAAAARVPAARAFASRAMRDARTRRRARRLRNRNRRSCRTGSQLQLNRRSAMHPDVLFHRPYPPIPDPEYVPPDPDEDDDNPVDPPEPYRHPEGDPPPPEPPVHARLAPRGRRGGRLTAAACVCRRTLAHLRGDGRVHCE